MSRMITPQKLLHGLPTKKRASGALAIVADGRMVAQAFVNPTRGLRVDVKAAPGRKARGPFRPTRSAGQWSAYAYVTPDNADTVRQVLERLVGAA